MSEFVNKRIYQSKFDKKPSKLDIVVAICRVIGYGYIKLNLIKNRSKNFFEKILAFLKNFYPRDCLL